MSDNQLDLSVVVLCYRAGERAKVFVNSVISCLNSLSINWEIVLVGNYIKDTDDNTPTVVQELASSNPKIKAIAHPKEGWMGWDAREGFRLCTGSVIGFIDGDEQMNAEDIGTAYRFIKDEGYDVAMTYRKTRRDPWIRRINSKIYNFTFNAFFPGYPIHDVNSKPKLFKREAFQKLHLTSNDWFLDAEMMIQCRRLRFKLKQFPTVFHRASYRKSFVRCDTIFEFIVNLFKARIKEYFLHSGKQKELTATT